MKIFLSSHYALVTFPFPGELELNSTQGSCKLFVVEMKDDKRNCLKVNYKYNMSTHA